MNRITRSPFKFIIYGGDSTEKECFKPDWEKRRNYANQLLPLQ